MLTLLSVKNLAVVESTQVTFGPGLNVITGETGAGKSVLMGALHLIMGERADKGLIRTGETAASVTAVFDLPNIEATNAVLDDLGLDPCEESTLIIRRTLTMTGSGKVSINDQPATATALKALTPSLLSIHGPYDQQKLLDPNFQRDLLTAYADGHAALRRYQVAWSKWMEAKRLLLDMQGDPEARAEEIDRLTYAIEDISAINPTDEDGEVLLARHAAAANASHIIELGNQISQALTDGENPIFNQLTQVAHLLAQWRKISPAIAEQQSLCESTIIQVQDLSQAIAKTLSDIDEDHDSFEALEQRMAEIQRLKRRYGKTIPEILERLQIDRTRLEALNSYDERIADLQAQVDRCAQALDDAAQDLTTARQVAIPDLCQAITHELHELGFKQSNFSIQCAPTDYTIQGADLVTFCFAPNPGEADRPLHLIASSGEIARVMLAVKTILARHDRIPTAIFDEIDANIGGETCRKVGEKLQGLAHDQQIICITHQPQAAAYGHHHYCVVKRTDSGRTLTSITSLSDEERMNELARMLGGKDLTSVTLEHAREMLHACAPTQSERLPL